MKCMFLIYIYKINSQIYIWFFIRCQVLRQFNKSDHHNIWSIWNMTVVYKYPLIYLSYTQFVHCFWHFFRILCAIFLGFLRKKILTQQRRLSRHVKISYRLRLCNSTFWWLNFLRSFWPCFQFQNYNKF